MTVYKPVESQPDFPALDKKIISYWDGLDIVQRATTTNMRNQPIFSFLEGPPTANGHPGSHHIESRTFKDIVCKYKAMNGFYVPRKAGWDTHGLPVELEVEKALGFTTKEDIVKYGVGNFNKKCKESVFKYQSEWEDITKKIGFWIDMKHPYITYTNDYIESVWWSLKKTFDAGLLYKGYKILPYCVRCGTALSSHEVAQGYKNVEETSIFIKFKAKEFENTYFLAWTTTPWTLISNLALAVNPDARYVHVKCKDANYILAKEKLYLIKDKAESGEPEILYEFDGSEIQGKSYEPLYNFHDLKHPGIWRVITADWVTMEDGSGIVHTAPAFGEVDYEAGREFGLPMYNPVKITGEFDEKVTPFKGMFVKKADPLIMDDLKMRGLLFHPMPYRHDYPFCWRCDTPLLYYALDTWFIKMTEVQANLMKNNEQIHWFPNHLKHGRFGNFLENVRDWALSRSRYWGTPLPIWICLDGHQTAIGSFDELRKMSGLPLTDLDPHKPYVDEILIKCPKCQKDAKRVEEVIDCWYDSGASTFAQFHYPFENQEEFKKRFPYDFISEGIDQTRGWFYTLLAISTLTFDQPAYKNVMSLGLVLDEKGEKMSKTRGNMVNPFEVLAKLGSDAMKYYFASQAPWADKKFGVGQVRERAYPMLNALWGSYFFYVTYANLDGFDPMKKEHQVTITERPEIDRWLISRYQKMLKESTQLMESYDVHKAHERYAEFLVYDLSLWYVRVCRTRFWKEEMSRDKVSALSTLYEVLVGCSKAMAPCISFVCEEIYQNLAGSVGKHEESVLLADYPKVENAQIDDALEAKMARVQELVKLVRRMREKVKIKNRQPLKELVIGSKKDMSKQTEDLLWIISAETNVKDIIFRTPERLGEYTIPVIKPNMKALGPVLKKEIGQAAGAYAALDAAMVIADIEKNGKFPTKIGSVSIDLTKDNVAMSTEPKKDYEAQELGELGEVKLFLNTALSEELELEGLMRELIRRIQVMRKEQALEYDAKIDIYMDASLPEVKKTLNVHGEKIKAETQAVSIVEALSPDFATSEWEIDEKAVKVGIRKILK